MTRHVDRFACIERHGWNLTRAAKALRTSTTSLRRWLFKRGLERPAWSKRLGGRRQPTVRVRSTETGLEKLCRWCPNGGAWLPLDECFHVSKRGAMGRANICKACKSDHNRILVQRSGTGRARP